MHCALTLALLVGLVGLGAGLVGSGAQGVLGVTLSLSRLVLGLPKQLSCLLLRAVQVALALLLGLAGLVLQADTPQSTIILDQSAKNSAHAIADLANACVETLNLAHAFWPMTTHACLHRMRLDFQDLLTTTEPRCLIRQTIEEGLGSRGKGCAAREEGGEGSWRTWPWPNILLAWSLAESR